MQSRNKPAPTRREREHIARVKMLPCSVCDFGGGESQPSEAHEVIQGVWHLAIALCASCHRDGFSGLHGQKRAWAVRKLDELDALAITIERLMA